MSKGRRDLTGEEKRLWRRVAASVKPRAKPAEREEDAPPSRGGRAARTPTAPAPAALSRRTEPPPALDRVGERRVRRGKVVIDATLDLHGHTQDSGRAALVRFLRAAQARGGKTVVVVTGVGRGGEGVLKRRLPEWLAEADLRPLVSGFAQAHRAHGGAGAFYVFIRRPR